MSALPKKIAVLMGGPGSERDVSLATGRGVAKALRSLGCDVSEVDVRDETFELPPGTELAFITIHGTFGEDGQLQGILAARSVSYTGDDVRGSANAFDKIESKKKFEVGNVTTPRWEVISAGDRPTLSVPLVIKPPRQGSTVGVQIVKSINQLESALAEVAKFDDELLVEEFIPGRELTVGVLGEQALPILEIIPKGGFYDFNNKYPFLNPQAGGAAEHVCPAKIDNALTRRIQELVLRAFRSLGLRVYGRVDVLLPASGEPTVLEVNTIPGMTEASLLPEAAAAAGISYPELCARIIELSQRERRRRDEKATQPRVRNQRVSNTRQRKQQHLLDVKVRARKATQHRNRAFLFLSRKLCSRLRFARGSTSARSSASVTSFENRDYNLAMIDVQTDGTLQRDQVLKEADLNEGENIFRVNLAQVHHALEQLPQVDEVQVVRKMPGEIDIRISERKPIAWITSEKQMSDPFQSDVAFLIDARGALMTEKKLLPEYLGLPLITGCRSESLEAGKVVESIEAKAALELLRLSAGSFMQTRFQIREIDVSKGYCLIVTDKNRTRVTLGFDHLDQQIQRLEQFLVYADDSKRDIETVNLMVARNIPVTFMKPASGIINDTIDPEETPRIMKAIPVRPSPATKPGAKPPPAEKTQNGPQPFSLRKEKQPNEEKNGE